jgi:SAM-dependent methyltransferase
MCVCRRCGFVFNAAFATPQSLYDERYDNSQIHSRRFAEHLEEMAGNVLAHPLQGPRRIVEIGCGQGQFLEYLVERAGQDATGFGCDPSYRGPRTALEGRVRYEQRYFGAEKETAADIVVCRHVIEHVPDPLGMMRDLRAALHNSPHARVFFETPCVDWILRNGVVWDLFYEHCSLFSLTSLSSLFRRCGFHVEQLKHVFAGQYLWIEAVPEESSCEDARIPGSTPQLAAQFAEVESVLVQGWRTMVSRAALDGPAALWGAGAKGVTFANLADPDAERLVCVIDQNPAKQGGYLAGTGHAVSAPHADVLRLLSTVFITNPNYHTEVSDALSRAGSAARVVNLMECAPCATLSTTSLAA